MLTRANRSLAHPQLVTEELGMKMEKLELTSLGSAKKVRTHERLVGRTGGHMSWEVQRM